jgi:hypothetical protein
MKRLLIVLLVVLFVLGASGCTKKSENFVNEFGTLVIETTPEGAGVSIDGKSMGSTPLNNLTILYGKHRITITKYGYKDLNKDVNIDDSNKSVKLSFILEKDTDFANVIIKTNGTLLIVVDKHLTWKMTNQPFTIKKSMHEIQLVGGDNKDYSLIGTFDIKDDIVLTENDFKKENLQIPNGQLFYPVQFMGPPIMRCCSYSIFTYSDIYVNQTILLKGHTNKTIKSFYIIFPSGKKMKVDTVKGNCDDCTNCFEKLVAFDEQGAYSIKETEGEDQILGESFIVDYKPKIISSVIKLKELFPYLQAPYTDRAIIAFENDEIIVKLLITDANGVIMRNTDIGAYGLKTDNNGVVTFDILMKPNSTSADPFCCSDDTIINNKVAGFMIYGDIIASAVRRKTINKKYAENINGSLYFPKETVAYSIPSYEMPSIITVDGKEYVNIGQIVDFPGNYPDITIKDNGNEVTIYTLLGKAP